LRIAELTRALMGWHLADGNERRSLGGQRARSLPRNAVRCVLSELASDDARKRRPKFT
jgi:hypothetical protein